MTSNILFTEFIDPFQPGNVFIRSEYYMRYAFAGELVQKQKRSPSVVYDIGCGNGYGLKIITELNGTIHGTAQRHFGFDNSAMLLSLAKQKELPGTSFCSIDFESESLSHTVKKYAIPKPNVVIAFEILEHLENPEKLLQEIHSILPPNGLFFLSVPNEQYEPKKNGKSKNSYHKQLFSEERITALLTHAGFNIRSRHGQPQANMLYHTYKAHLKFLETLFRFMPLLFPPFARFVGRLSDSPEGSYSFIFVTQK